MNLIQFNRLYQSILSGNVQNIKYAELCDFVVDLGFEFNRQNGTSHKIYTIEGLERPLVLQEGKNGCAKPYQVKQVKEEIKKLKIGGKENV